MSDGIVRAVPKEYRAPRPKKWLGKNEGRAAAKFRDAFHSEEYVDFIKGLGCTVANCRKLDIECAHAGPLRVKGGKWFEIVPLCAAHHREQEGKTEQFNQRHGVDLLDIAARLALRWKERIKPENDDLYPAEPLSGRTSEGIR